MANTSTKIDDVIFLGRILRDALDEAGGFERIECDACSAVEEIGGEINERTLEDEGWELGPNVNYCPDHAEGEGRVTGYDYSNLRSGIEATGVQSTQLFRESAGR